MSERVIFACSACLAVLVHGGVVVLMLLNWESSEALETLPPEQYYIAASVVSKNPYTERDRKAQEQRRARDARARERRRQAELRAQREAQANAAKPPEPAPVEPVARIEEAPVPAPVPAFDRESERQEMEANLALLMAEELEQRKAVTDDEKAMAFVAQIQREIVQNWSRPPSARNGMETILRVHLIPTGEVVDVVVEDSSGNAAFDRSALVAVKKARRFQVPQESRQFEKNFREFTVLFRPEDLRL